MEENRAPFRMELMKKTEQFFAEHNAEYGDVMWTLNHLIVVYHEKGANLLDKRSAQEVQEMPRRF